MIDILIFQTDNIHGCLPCWDADDKAHAIFIAKGRLKKKTLRFIMAMVNNRLTDGRMDGFCQCGSHRRPRQIRPACFVLCLVYLRPQLCAPIGYSITGIDSIQKRCQLQPLTIQFPRPDRAHACDDELLVV